MLTCRKYNQSYGDRLKEYSQVAGERNKEMTTIMEKKKKKGVEDKQHGSTGKWNQVFLQKTTRQMESTYFESVAQDKQVVNSTKAKNF